MTKPLKKMTTDQLRKEALRLQKKNGILKKVRRFIRGVPEASTRFQLQLDIAARRELAKQKKALKRKGKRALIQGIRELRREL